MVADHTFTLMLLTPEQTVFGGEYVEVPGSEGYLGVLADHAALVTGVSAGRLAVRWDEGGTDVWQVAGGGFEVLANRATVLADAVSGGPKG